MYRVQFYPIHSSSSLMWLVFLSSIIESHKKDTTRHFQIILRSHEGFISTNDTPITFLTLWSTSNKSIFSSWRHTICLNNTRTPPRFTIPFYLPIRPFRRLRVAHPPFSLVRGGDINWLSPVHGCLPRFPSQRRRNLNQLATKQLKHPTNAISNIHGLSSWESKTDIEISNRC